MLGDGLAATAIVTGEGVLALQASGGDRVADFVRDARRDPPQARQPFRAGDADRHLLRLRLAFANRSPASLRASMIRSSSRSPVRGTDWHAAAPGLAKRDLDISHMAPPDEQRATEPCGHQDHQCEQDAEAELQRA